jgi:glucose-1-phosphate thymidylyltransferase
MNPRGILLAGGNGTRLLPLTGVTCKQLLPVYDKPMIYYPLTTLMLSGCREILVISTPEATPLLERFLGNGSRLGLSLRYKVQNRPNGIAEAILLAEEFIGGAKRVHLALGDNIFYGAGLHAMLSERAARTDGAVVFAAHVSDPERFGVVSFAPDGTIRDIVEKPKRPPSPYAVTGFYMYDARAVGYAKRLKPSSRGELEITDLNRVYLEEGKLSAQILGRGNMWMDVGTHDALLAASGFIAQVYERQGLKIGCPEEVAWRLGLIGDAQLSALAGECVGSGYGRYLQGLLDAPPSAPLAADVPHRKQAAALHAANDAW